MLRILAFICRRVKRVETRDRRSVSTGGRVFGGRGERIRTSDLSVPNAALYQAEPRPDNSDVLVPKVGVEPTWSCPQRFLRPSRLPFRHFGITRGIIAERADKVKPDSVQSSK